MSYKALVIDDDPAVFDSVADILTSLGHNHDWARSQEEARNFVKANEYSYVLLDLEIPARSRGSTPRIQNSVNLLDEISSTGGPEAVPIIVMTGCTARKSEMAAEMMRLGAFMVKKGVVDFINKPFPTTGRTLDRVIKKNIARRPPAHSPEPVVIPPKPKKDQPFKGGELVFYPDRVELCGVKILGDTGIGQMRKILEALKETKAGGKFVAYSGAQLAKATKTRGGQNAAAGCIRGFRNTVTKTLEEEAGLICGQQDVIQSGGRGYRLNEWITVRENESAVTGSAAHGHDLDDSNNVPNDHENVPNDVPNSHVNDPNDDLINDRVKKRREWIIAELKGGRRLYAPVIATRLKCSSKTARRDLDALKARGMIKFVGPPRTGHYCLKG